jgi:DNA modification methylase
MESNFKNIEDWPIEKLIPYARNARTHSDKQLGQIAASISEWGFTNPIIADAYGNVIAGHGRLLAAQKLGRTHVPVRIVSDWPDAKKKAYILVDNKLALNAGWDDELLSLEIEELKELDFDINLIGFEDFEIDEIIKDPIQLPPVDIDELTEPPLNPTTKKGDIWKLGEHRVMCGDSTVMTDVEQLMAGAKAALLHADPPYGMGKQKNGIANDNLQNEDLDKFHMEWWATFRPFLLHNASAYIWGNATELWRLWYKAGLGSSEKMELRNQIVWDKKAIPGMASTNLTQFPIATEHCLFFQLGKQFLDHVNVDDFPETWEPLRAYLADEAKAAGVGSSEINSLCGVQMYGHWFTRSQFMLIPEKHYATLRANYAGRFIRPWRQLKDEWDKVKGGPTREIQAARSYFDNAHDVMRDVWEFSRVTGEERHGHATPKPVAMMERVMLSSLPKGGLCVEPFGGSGSTLMGAERTGRVCYAMELNPIYCDTIVRRWQKISGKKAVNEATGNIYDNERI